MVLGKFDIVFAVDGSATVDDLAFRKIKLFIKNALLSYKISENDAKIGIVGIGDKPRSYLKLFDGKNMDSVLYAIRNLKNMGGSRDLTEVLRYVNTDIFTAAQKRVNGKQNLVVISTGGDESGNEAGMLEQVKQLTNRGVKIISVLIGRKLGNAEKLSQKQNIIYVNGGLRVLPRYLGTLESQIGIGQGNSF